MNATPPPFDIDPELAETVLALADDELILGHRHSEWLGLSPFLEEDLAMASIAQDELGHARALYGVLWPSWESRDALVTLRPAEAWRCCALVELDARPWERHLVRHVFYDVIEEHRWHAFADVVVPRLAEVSDRVLAEERWHRRHAVDLFFRLAPSGADRLQQQIDDLAPMLGALMNGLSAEDRTRAVTDLATVVHDAGLAMPQHFVSTIGDRRTRTTAFAAVHDSLTEVAAIDRAATW